MSGILDSELVLEGQGYVALTGQLGDEKTIADAARICYNGECTSEYTSKDKTLLCTLIRREHWSPFEQVVLSFYVKAPIFVVRQWFRHRTWSYLEKSRRYCKDIPEFYMPPETRMVTKDVGKALALIESSYKDAVAKYNELLDMNVPKEVARIILPVSLMTEFKGTVDLRNFISFIDLRSAPGAQAEIREYANAMKRMVAKRMPVLAEALKWEIEG